MTAAPNLFDYATSELSQDAFLAWLVAHADCDSRPQVQAASKAFIAMLWNTAKGPPEVGADAITLLTRPKRQAAKIDVLFEASINGRPTIFVIEDKTDTSHHSDQLARYRTHVEATRTDHEIVLVYLKTGFHFDSDSSAEAQGYAIVNLRQVVDCLGGYAVESEIYGDYLGRARQILEHREHSLAELRSPEGYKALKHDFVQFTLAQELKDAWPDNVGGLEVHRGRSIGGAPCTHLRFASFPGLYGSKMGEVLYHRIDARKGDAAKGEKRVRRYYLSTRQYAKVEDSESARAKKKVRLAELRLLFEQAKKESKTDLVFGKPSTDNAGANESEIAILLFDDASNSVDEVIAGMKDLHARFVSLVRSQLAPPLES